MALIGRLAEHPIGAMWSYSDTLYPTFLFLSPFRQFQKTFGADADHFSPRTTWQHKDSCIFQRDVRHFTKRGARYTTYVAEKSHDARLLPLHDHSVSNGDCVSFSFLLFSRARMQPVDRLSRYSPITSHTHLSLSNGSALSILINYFDFFNASRMIHCRAPLAGQTRRSKCVSLAVSTSRK